MFRSLLVVLSLFGLIVPAMTAAEKKRDWQIGQVLDAQMGTAYAGSTSRSTPVPGIKPDGRYSTQASTVTNTSADYDVSFIVTVQGDTLIYVASERITVLHRKAANLTVNAPVKFAIEKDKLFVVDEDGKEHESHINKKILRANGDNGSKQPVKE
jgi:hypothetical protein